MSKQKKVFPILIGVYIISIISIAFILLSIPSTYKKMQVDTYKEIKNELTTKLSANADTITYEELYKNNPIEFIIYNETTDSFVFMSLPIENPENLKAMLNQNAIGKEEIFNLTTDDGNTYSIWLAQYHLSPQTIIDTWFFYLLLAAFILFSIILLAVGYVIMRIIHPLKTLRDNIYKVSSYQLETLKNELPQDDVLSHELQLFSKDLLNKIEHAESTYTSLEKELKLENETANYRAQLFASLIHDLKSPLHLAQIQVEKVLDLHPEFDEETATYLVDAASKHEQALDDVSSIIKTVFAPDNTELDSITTFDLVTLVGEVETLFIKQMTDLHFDLDLITDAQVMMNGNYIRMKQLIHNAFTNIIAHAHAGALVVVECYKEGNNIVLSFYNDAEPMSNQDLSRIFELFYHTGKSDLSTGIGLFTVKQIVEENAGIVTFTNKDNGVELLCSFSQ